MKYSPEAFSKRKENKPLVKPNTEFNEIKNNSEEEVIDTTNVELDTIPDWLKGSFEEPKKEEKKGEQKNTKSE